MDRTGTSDAPTTLRPMPAPRATPELVAITGSRFVIGAALFVVHVVFFARLAGVDHAWFDQVVAVGRAGVSYFFALSGFLLACAYGPRFAAPSARRVLTFYGARVAALWPVHLVGLAMLLPLYANDVAAAPVSALVGIAANAVLLHAWLPFSHGEQLLTLSLNTPSWSLSALVGFYLALPPIMWLLLTVLRVGARGLLAIAAGSWLSTVALAVAFQDDAVSSWAFHYFPLLRFSEFLGGACIGLLFVRTRARARDVGLGGAAAAPRTALATLVEVGAIGLWVGWATAGTLLPSTLSAGAWALPAMLVLVWVLARDRGAIGWLLGRGVTRRLGSITLPFAMLHFPILAYAAAFGLFGSWGVVATTTVAFLASLVVAGLAYRVVEVPAKAAIRRRVGRWVDSLEDPLPVEVPARVERAERRDAA